MILVDTHCHINNMVKKDFDVPLLPAQNADIQNIIRQAADNDVALIINVGTSLVESKNSITIAKQSDHVYAAIGIHPNDATSSWMTDFKELVMLAKHKEEHKIVAIGECGLDMHYPDYNLQRQKDVFKAHIELALEHNLALLVHTRDARDETLRSLEEFKGQITRGVIHCFSEDQAFANTVIEWNFYLGIGGTITYPKNNALRDIVINTSLQHIVLETDAPFLPIQTMRGKQNHPQYIKNIAEYIAHLRQESLESFAQTTTANALKLCKLQDKFSF